MVVPAVLYGIVIGAIRLVPIAIRIGGKIVGISYRIAAKPNNFRHAQRIFGKKTVLRDGTTEKIISQISRHNTRVKTFSPIKSEAIKNQIKGSAEVAKNIGSQADDAALNLSRFFSTARVQPSGGVKIAGPIKEIFGKNIKFSNKTLEAIKIAERGPLSISKDVAKIIPKPGVTVGAPKTIRPDPKFLKEFPGKRPKGRELSVVKPITVTKDRPWYVNIMPKHLRTRKETLDTSTAIYPHGVRTITEGVAKGKLARDVGISYGAYEGVKYIASNIDDTDKITRSSIDLNDSDLFETASQEYGQEEIASGINIYDTDEAGNVIQAQ